MSAVALAQRTARFRRPRALRLEIKHSAVVWVLPVLAVLFFLNAYRKAASYPPTWTVQSSVITGPNLVFFSVADTGVGMSEEFIKTRLFRPFATTKNKGIGLGLFTCKEIVETHGGRLEVESSPNSGTRFRVVIPSSLFKSGERHRRPEKVTASTSKAGPSASE